MNNDKLDLIEIILNDDYDEDEIVRIKSGDWINLMRKLNEIITELNNKS